MLQTLYALTIALSAALLFLVQPMVARMALPSLGGAPAVWNTALVFYQAALLAGYGYAHAATVGLGVRGRTLMHLGVALLPLGLLPVALPAGWAPPTEASPVPWLLAVLAVSVGAPFFVLAATGPMLQTWFAATGHRRAADPYFLYAAGNAGSLLGLASYPLLVEPSLRLADQSRLWAGGYGLLVLLTGACALALWRGRAAPGASFTGDGDRPDEGRPGLARRARWVLLALVPSSLMLSVTTHASTDIAAMPLLWVVPLGLYLLTFTLTFARRPLVPHRLVGEAMPLALVPVVLLLAARANEPLELVLPTHLLGFLVVALVCHGELARDRPGPQHLTAFYLWLAAGGVLGGALTALLAPRLFTEVAEYPLALVLACLLLPRPAGAWQGRTGRRLDVLLPLALGGAVAATLASLSTAGRGVDPAVAAPVLGIAALVCLAFSRRPLRFGLGVGALLLVAWLARGHEGRVLHAERSFFGVHRVTLDPSGRYHLLLHGTTLHGMQARDPARRQEPLSYFHRSGPLGQVFARPGGVAAGGRVAVVGLGAGSLACHGEAGQHWTFYELDPTVVALARDPRLFTFLRDCPPAVEVVLGDARLSLRRAPDAAYELIVLDAYGSDAPPIHLLTREAIALYLRKLRPDGLLVFNVTNRHLDLEPVLGRVARAEGLATLARHDAAIPAADRDAGRLPSRWVVMARQPAPLRLLAADPRWTPAAVSPGAPWTDDFGGIGLADLRLLRAAAPDR